MHRLLKLHSLYSQQLCVVSKSTITNNPIGNRTCDLCKQSTNMNAIRNRSTTNSSPLIQVSSAKRRTKKVKKYAELLEVRKQSTTETRASISKLKAKDLSLLAQEPEIGLNELHKIKTRSRFVNTTNAADPSLTTDPDEIIEHEHLETDGNVSHELNVEEKEEEQQQPISCGKERDKANKKEALKCTLGSHIEMCLAIGNLDRGLTSLLYYRHRADKCNSTPVKSIHIYNTLLHGYAAKANLTKILELLSYIREDNLQLNTQSYVAIYECLARQPNTEELNLRSFHQQMLQQNISFDDIMNSSSFLGEQRKLVLSAMRTIQPEYTPKYQEPSLQYTCDILKDLNHPEQLKSTGEEEVRLNCERLFTAERLKELTKRQLEIEMNGYVQVRSIESKSEGPTETVLQYRKLLNSLINDWRQTATKAFQYNLEIIEAQPQKGLKTLALDPYLKCLSVSDYINIILNEVRRLAEGSETYSPTTNQLYRELGSRVYARYQVQRQIRDGILEKICSIQEMYCEWYAKHYDNGGVLNKRQKWQWFDYQQIDNGSNVNGMMHHHVWPANVKIAIGEFLYKIIMHDLKIDVNVLRTNTAKQKFLPAFYTLFRSQGRILKEEVKPHPILARLFRGSEQEYLVFPAHEVPMLSPPKPWISIFSGGYLLVHSDFIRLPVQAVQQRKRLQNAAAPTLYPAMDSLNQLAAVPWKVNVAVLDVILEVFRSDGSVRLNVPQPPGACPAAPVLNASMSKTEKFQVFKQRMQTRRRRGEMYSLWCDALYRLSLANHFRDNIFWLPHNMDFRGRVYPVPPHLNHLGSDLARSILVFAESRPLGPSGLDWLKIHCINLTGLKKRDKVQDRLAYANEILSDILDSADKPLTGKMWWADSDEPWQTLACCIEIANASRSPDPVKFESRFPVHQDGSCNGLQHYAALGRDSTGAYNVNLTPTEIPQDVYSAVATLVETQRVKDAKAGIQIAQVLDGFVQRKVIKQTVMTTVYGVTRYGARLQIARQLKDIETFPKDMVWLGSSYLTTKTFESLRSMFTSTREIQDWFTECARLISAVNEQNVEWITPLGLPIVQPYSRYRKADYSKKTILENFTMDMFERPNTMKQKNAFPPNFIHSLDSSHMMLTSLFCERAAITFVSVHDCFWTHPCSVHIMNKICREQFVSLHSQPILEDLSEFLFRKFRHKEPDISKSSTVIGLTKRKLNRVLTKLPKKGDFDLNQILHSIYFFS